MTVLTRHWKSPLKTCSKNTFLFKKCLEPCVSSIWRGIGETEVLLSSRSEQVEEKESCCSCSHRGPENILSFYFFQGWFLPPWDDHYLIAMLPCLISSWELVLSNQEYSTNFLTSFHQRTAPAHRTPLSGNSILGCHPRSYNTCAQTIKATIVYA